jgi:hypothetical protein
MTEVSRTNDSGAAASAAPPDERHDPGPPPIQFRLKSLLLATAAMSVVFAAAGRLTGVWVVVLAWSLLLVAAHVVATVLGTQNAARAPSRRGGEPNRTESGAPVDTRSACAPTTRLSDNERLGWRLWCVTAGGAVVGCGVGTMLVALRDGDRLDWPALLLAAASSSGVGAFLTFLAAGCAKVAGRAWRQAGGDPARR